jgi:hypothetical protein
VNRPRIHRALATALYGAALAGCSGLLGLEPPSFDVPPSVDDAGDEVSEAIDAATPQTMPYADISAGQGAGSGLSPSALVDAKNKKLLVVTENGANAHKPTLFRCDLDGTGCSSIDISAGERSGSGYQPSAVIDGASGKLLVVTKDGAFSRPSLFRCNLDGTSCTHTDISAGQGENSGSFPSAVIDTTNRKLLVVTTNGASSNKPSLFRCNLDGTGCFHIDISAGVGANSGYSPSAVIDATNGKLLVVTENGASSFKPSLFRCDLDGTGCSHVDISAGQGSESGTAPQALIDATNGKLLVVTTERGSSSKPGLFRCDLDGTGCTHADISAGQATGSGDSPSAVIAAANGKLLVVTTNRASSNKASLFRCDVDGTGCVHVDISAGQGTGSGRNPSAVIDLVTKRLLVATTNESQHDKLSLFSVEY